MTDSTTDKIKGVANQVGGKIREGVGAAVDDPEMEAKGKAQQVKGDLQEAKGDAKDAVKRGVDKI